MLNLDLKKKTILTKNEFESENKLKKIESIAPIPSGFINDEAIAIKIN